MSNFRRRLIIENNQLRGLPASYIRLPYIKTLLGKEYKLSTGCIVTDKTELEVVFKHDLVPPITEFTADCLYSNNSHYRFGYWQILNHEDIQIHYYLKWFNLPVTKGQKHTIIQNNKYTIVDGQILQEWSGVKEFTGNELVFFKDYRYKWKSSIGELYSIKIKENGVLVSEMIPAQSADGKIGMYDIIKRKFRTSETTDGFTI